MTNETQPELIPVQSAHVTQLTEGAVKGDWKVRQNITSLDLFTLPPHFSEEEVFLILEFVRKYELNALNVGINFQKGKQNEFLKQQSDSLRKLVGDLTQENDRITSLLEAALEREE